MFFEECTQSVVCRLSPEEALRRLAESQAAFNDSQPRINRQCLALGAPRTETGPDGAPVVAVQGSFGSFLVSFRFTQTEENGIPATEAAMTMKMAPGLLIFIGVFLLLFLFFGSRSPYVSFSELLGMGFLLFLALFGPIYLIGRLSLPYAADRLWQQISFSLLR